VEGLLPEALAWIPQSTVALTINRGMLRIEKECPETKLLLQVHDSTVFQVPIELFRDVAYRLRLKECFNNPIPYPRPLTIGTDIKFSEKSWGDCRGIKWDETVTIG
jgi:DNA polymerase I-like protein with 3'-5' exonuclease and polymerase domains